MTTSKKPPFDPHGRSYAPRSRAPVTPIEQRRQNLAPLDVTATLAGKNIIVVGGTGFLGKVLISLILKRFPDVGHIYLMVRGKGGLTPKDRFEQEVWETPCFDPCRSDYSISGEAGKVDLYTKLTQFFGHTRHKTGTSLS